MPGCSPGAACAASAARAFRAALAGPFPPEVGYVSLYSRTDGIVDWRSCLDPDAVVRRGPRVALRHEPQRDAYRAIARALWSCSDAGWAQAA